MSLKKASILIIIILLIDQISKIYIKTHFILGEEVSIFSWFKIYFIENAGMAWGAKIPGYYGKLILTLSRLIAVTGIGYWLYDTTKKEGSSLLIIAIAMILAGALGNIIDSVFYGIIFNDSHYQIAHLFASNTYGTLFHGNVVDMLYFPIWEGILPNWIPFYGGKHFIFFEPIFNIADVAISSGVGILLVFNKKAFSKKV